MPTVTMLLGLLIAPLNCTVPLLIDVDKYRPLIIQKADEQLNGKLELGKLGLSLWGRVKIEIAPPKTEDLPAAKSSRSGQVIRGVVGVLPC